MTQFVFCPEEAFDNETATSEAREAAKLGIGYLVRVLERDPARQESLVQFPYNVMVRVPDCTLVRLVEEPLSREEILALQDSDRVLSVVVPASFGDLVCHDLKGLNNLIDERIFGCAGLCLSDIDYKIVGASRGDVLLRVTGEVDEFEVGEELV